MYPSNKLKCSNSLKIALCFSLLTPLSSFAQKDDSEHSRFDLSPSQINNLRTNKLKHYGFARDSFNKEDMTLLIGNAEMGGRARLDGLGFDRIWFSDFWRTNAARQPIFGPKFFFDNDGKYNAYQQSLSIENAVLKTQAAQSNASYKSEIFFSTANKDLLVIRLSDLKGTAKESLKLHIPIFDVDGTKGGRWEVYQSPTDKLFTIKQETPHMLFGTSIDSVMNQWKRMFGNGNAPHTTNKMVYGIWCSASLTPAEGAGNYKVDTKGKNEVLLLFAEATNWRSDLQKSTVQDALANSHNFTHLLKAHSDAWDQDWKRTAVLDIPDKRHDQLWYRSIFWLFCTSASQHFLPGECQFSHEGWNMLPFTYGGGGWGIHDFTMLGYPEKAEVMMANHMHAAAHHRNALHWLAYAENERKVTKMTEKPPFPQDPKCPDARVFAHEVRTSGDGTLGLYGNQAHLTGFSLELFLRHYRYYPSDELLYNALYPISKGVAEFWSNFLIWDHKKKEYYTPKTWGSSEGKRQNNTIDAVMAAKKCLYTAVKLANQLNVDQELTKKWTFIAKNIHFPQNDKTYVAFRGDDGKIPEKSTGYNGVRYMNVANFVNEEFLDEFDTKKVTDLLGKISKSNHFGTGFAVFHSAQTATAECMYGRGDSALGYLDGILRAYDKSGTAIRECEDRTMPYFLTNTDAYILVPIMMVMQSTKGEIKTFPAVPSSWKNVAFYNLPAENGIKVSGAMKNGKVVWIKKQNTQPAQSTTNSAKKNK